MPSPIAALSVADPCSLKKNIKSPDKAHRLQVFLPHLQRHMAPIPSCFSHVRHLMLMEIQNKPDSFRAITKYKARLVARGDMQHLGFASVFAPTVDIPHSVSSLL